MAAREPMTLSGLAESIRAFSFIGGAAASSVAFLGFLLWATYGDALIKASGLATSSDVAELRLEVRRLAGDDRIVRVDDARSFVREPVYRGEPVTAVYFMRRTLSGVDCIFMGGVTVFEDELGVRLSGSRLKRQRQISTEIARLLINADLPDGLAAGRVAMHLEMEYQCDGETRFERTDPIIFRLLER